MILVSSLIYLFIVLIYNFFNFSGRIDIDKSFLYIMYCIIIGFSFLILNQDIIDFFCYLFCNDLLLFDYRLFFSLFILIIVFFSLPILFHYVKKYMFSLVEYFLIFLFAIISGISMLYTYYLLLFFLFFEMHNMCLYILISFSKTNGNFIESGLKYFILSSFSSVIMLLGISFLYYSFGTLDLLQIQSILVVSNIYGLSFFMDFGFILLLLGFLFKLYCVPFHFWVPDIYHGSPTSSTFMLACISYILVFSVFFTFFVNLRLVWIVNIYDIMFFFTILCLFIGGIGGLFQRQLKRLIAYSSISSIGYILYGFLERTELLYVDVFSYLFVYCVSLSGIFFLILCVEINLSIPLRNIESTNIDIFSGFFYINKYFAILLTFLFFSVSGIPPFLGFFVKFLIFEQTLYNTNLILFIFMVFNSLCACYYYFYFVKIMYYNKPLSNEIHLNLNTDIFFIIYILVLFLIIGTFFFIF